jgi:hypothetical protein
MGEFRILVWAGNTADYGERGFFCARFGPEQGFIRSGLGIIHALFQNHGLTFFPSRKQAFAQ